MGRFRIDGYGLGRYTNKNSSLVGPGYAVDSLNLLHNRDQNTVKTRNFVTRCYAARPANARHLNAFRLVKSDASVVYLLKIGSVLYAAANLAPATNPSSILTGMDSTHTASIVDANGLAFIADWGAKNYISNGTSGESHELQSNTNGGTMTFANNATVIVNPAGTISYDYTFSDPNTGEESPATGVVGTPMSRSANLGVDVTNVSLTFTAPYTKLNLYRNTAGSAQYYLVAANLTAADFPYHDNSTDASLTTVSTVHDEFGSPSTMKPAAAKHVAFFRGRVFFASGSFLAWSRVEEPTQFSNASSSNTYIGKFDGGEITGLVPFRGAMLIFKTNSIWVMNGDVDETTFTFQEAVPGKGCVAPWTIRRDGDDRVFFLSAHGVCTYDLNAVSQPPISDPIQPDIVALAYASRQDFFCAGIDPTRRQYKLSVSPTGASTNTKTHVINLDTGSWGRDEIAMGQAVPSCYSDVGVNGPLLNSTGQMKLYVGDENGYLYETDTAGLADGPASGDVQGTVTGAADTTHTTCSAAAFSTAGDTLKGLGLTVRRAADASYETVAITSNTATAFVHAAWAGAKPVAGDLVFPGAMHATLALGRFDLKTSLLKRWARLFATFQKQTATTPLRVGYTLNDDAAPTSSAEYDQSGGYFARHNLGHQRAYSLAPYFDIIGTNFAFELLGLDLEAEILARIRPTR